MVALCAGMCATLLCPTVGRAERAANGPALLDQAVAAYNDLRVEDALRLLDRAERAGNLGDRLAELHLYRGLGRASLGDNEVADVSFRLALALDSSLQLPPDTSPVVVQRFDELRRQAGGEPEATPEPEPEPEPDPVPVPEPQPQPQPQPEPERPMIATWVLLGLTGAAFVGGGTTLVLSQVTRSQARGEARSQADADEMLDAYRLELRLTFALLSATVALAATTLVAWLGERRPREAAPAVALLPSPGGLVLAGSFGR